MIWIILASTLAGVGCRAVDKERIEPGAVAGPRGGAAPRPSSRAQPSGPTTGPVPRGDAGVTRTAMGAVDDDEDDEDMDEDGSPAARGPEDVAVFGSDRPSRSPVLNREGPIGEQPAEIPGYDGASGLHGDAARSEKLREEGYDNQNGDGFLQPDLLLKALGLKAPATRVYGWVEGGILFNPAAPRDHRNLPETPSDLANRWQIQQVYLVIERTLKTVDRFDYGYRLDNLFGSDWGIFRDDGLLNSARTGTGYGYSPNQFYGEFHLPYLTAGGIDFRFGRFLSLAGYESAFAPGRPLRSSGYLFNYSHPFTHLGVLITLNLTDQIQVFNAPINGWDRWFNRHDKWGYMGGINWDSRDERTNLTLAYYAGPNQISRRLPRSPLNGHGPPPGPSEGIPGGEGGGFGPDRDVPGRKQRGDETLLVSAVLSHAWDERWTSVFEADSGAEMGVPIFWNVPQFTRKSSWYGASTWLLYTYNEHWTGVVRSGIFRDVGGLRTGFDDTFYEVALGLIFKPTAWFWVRPEIDYDGATGDPPFSTRDGRTNNQVVFGFDVLFLY